MVNISMLLSMSGTPAPAFGWTSYLHAAEISSALLSILGKASSAMLCKGFFITLTWSASKLPAIHRRGFLLLTLQYHTISMYTYMVRIIIMLLAALIQIQTVLSSCIIPFKDYIT